MNALSFLRSQESNYNVKQPNMFIVNESNDNLITNRNDAQLFGIFNTVSQSNTETRQVSSSPFTRFFNYIVHSDAPQHLYESNIFCSKFSNKGIGSNTLTDYINNHYNLNAVSRCGWIYNKKNNTFTGHYGINGLPVTVVDKSASNYVSYKPGTPIRENDTIWWWNLTDPTLEIFKNFYDCSMTNCDGKSNLPNCGWDSNQKMGVPQNLGMRTYTDLNDPFNTGSNANGTYNSYGTLLYNNEACPTGSSTTPDGTTITSEAECRARFPTCSNGVTNNRLCLRDLNIAAGCTNNGTIALALDTGIGSVSGNPFYLNQSNSYNRYVNDITLNNVRDVFNSACNITCYDALEDFKYLHSNAQKPYNSSSNAAPIDLCLSNGVYDQYDFCSEYGAGSVNTIYNPFKVECMQREFRKQGGQIKGTAYPLSNTLNLGSTWSDYTSYVADLLTKTRSSDIQVQANAFMQFYGIPMQQYSRQEIPNVQGVEVFWLTTDTPQRFLGRRIQNNLDLKLANLQNTNISFVSFFNLRPSNSISNVDIDIQTTNTVAVSLNSWINPSCNAFQYGASPLTTSGNKRNSACANNNINSSNPNYYTVEWSATTSPLFTITYKDCTSSNAVPEAYYTLSQEPDAPMMSFDVEPAPTENQLTYFSVDQQLAYFFGDARLRYNITMTPSPSGSGFNFDSTKNFGFSDRQLVSYLYGALSLTNTQLLETSVDIGTQSWRSLSMLFSISVLPTSIEPKQFIFQYGTLSISAFYTGSGCIIRIDDTNKTGITGITGIQLTTYPLALNTSYYLAIIQDQPENNPYGPVTNIRICCAPLSVVQDDPTIIFSTETLATTTGYYYDNTTDYWGVTVKGSKMIIGGYDGTVIRSLNMNVGWLRVFDYVFNTDDIADDVNNRWKRNWFNMI